ncbi:MAG: hypothetical protein AB7E79_07395 [Rhodospirillaceae bacterium]
MAYERIKVLSYPDGEFVLSSAQASPPCRYRVRWCPKDGHIVQLANEATAEQAVKSIREYRVLGDTIDHLMAFELELE